MTVDTPNGAAKVLDVWRNSQNEPVILVRHANGATWIWSPGEIDTRSAVDTAKLNARIISAVQR